MFFQKDPATVNLSVLLYIFLILHLLSETRLFLRVLLLYVFFCVLTVENSKKIEMGDPTKCKIRSVFNFFRFRAHQGPWLDFDGYAWLCFSRFAPIFAWDKFYWKRYEVMSSTVRQGERSSNKIQRNTPVKMYAHKNQTSITLAMSSIRSSRSALDTSFGALYCAFKMKFTQY